MPCQVRSHLADQDRRNQGLITLHIDDDLVIVPLHFFHDLTESFGTRGMFRRSHADAGRKGARAACLDAGGHQSRMITVSAPLWRALS
nr:hypothetical protein [uncultured bacterium]